MIDIPFPHKPPKDYSYEQVSFKTNVVAVWIVCHRRFDYNLGHPTRSIWGFYNRKTKTYHSPIGPTKCGDPIEIEETTPYSAVKIKRSPLEAFFV